MSDTLSQTPTDLSGTNTIMILIHTVQLILAIIILGLTAYEVQYVAYNVLIYSVVVCICTVVVCIYLIGSRGWFRRLYAPYIVAAYHVWMLIFWSVDLGLVAHLAELWQGPKCTYDFRNGDSCAPYDKRDAPARPKTTYTTYSETLVAGAVLAAFQVILWTLAVSLLFLQMKKLLASDPVSSRQAARSQQSSVRPDRFGSSPNDPNLPEPIGLSLESWGASPPSAKVTPEFVIPDLPSPNGESQFRGAYFGDSLSTYRPDIGWMLQDTNVTDFGRFSPDAPAQSRTYRSDATSQPSLPTEVGQEVRTGSPWTITNPSADSTRSTPDRSEGHEVGLVV